MLAKLGHRQGVYYVILYVSVLQASTSFDQLAYQPHIEAFLAGS